MKLTRRHIILPFIFSLCVSALAQTPPTEQERILVPVRKKTAADKQKKPLPSADRPELVLQTGHSEKAEALAFSPDGRYLATGGSDRTIKIWDAVQRRELRTLTGHTGAVRALAFSPDGQTLAAGGNEGRIRLWQLAAGREAAIFGNHSKPIRALAFSPDGRALASGSEDFLVKVWDIAARSERHNFTGHYGSVLAVAFSPNGRTLASAGVDKTIKLWELAAPGEPVTFSGHTETVRALAFSPNGNQLSSGGQDLTLRLWQLPRGKLLHELRGHAAALLVVAFSPDGQQVLTCAADRTIKRFNAASGGEVQALAEREGFEQYEAAVFSPDGQWLASASGTRRISLRPAAAKGAAYTLDSRSNAVKALAFSPDDRWFATGNQDTSVTLWETVSGRAVATLAGNAGSVTALAFSPDSQTLATGSLGGVIKLWDVFAAREVKSWTAHGDGVNALVFAPDGQRLFSGSNDATIKLWDAATAAELAVLKGHERDVTALSLSSDGALLASASADQTVRLWNAATKQHVRTLSGARGTVFAVAFSPDGKQLAAGGEDQAVRLWEAATGHLLRTFSGHTSTVYSAAFAPDGQMVAAGGASGEIKLWETATGRQKFNLTGHAGEINALGFGGEGRWLMSGSEDGTARLWDAGTGEWAATLVGLRGGADWLVVTPDGLFDGSSAAWGQILWRFARNTFSAAPVELFFNEFYYPELLAEVLAGKAPLPAENIAQLDRRQPRVQLQLGDNSPVDSRTLTVKVEIAQAPPNAEHKEGSGVRDVRLFRNGSLVKAWRGDVLKGQSAITLETVLPLVAGENRLTAYAFNRDDIKSSDETLVVNGGAGLRRRGVVYLLAVGVNQYENAAYNLRFAVNDALAFSNEVQRQQVKLARYAEVVIVRLLDAQATKANILTALRRLTNGAALPDGAPPELTRLQAAQPEDAVIIYFAGHGTALEDRFYLIPHDLGYRGSREELTEVGLQSVLEHSLSDAELEAALENLDAGQLLFVLDACNSGQALEAEEKRRGPMNSKGLAQLAYEKGMNILTAAQSYQLAIETPALGHGYLTYALVEEGLKKLAADAQPRDGQVSVREWLDHATQAVPRLQEAKAAAERSRGLVVRRPTRILTTRSALDVQRPRVFYRREPEAQPFVVAASQ